MSDEIKKNADQELIIDYRQVGATGLRRFSGFIYEEFLQELTGWKGVQVYKEMSENDAACSALLFAIDKLVRKVPWRVQPASDQPFDIEAAEFLESCMDDMDNTWIDMIGEVLSMLTYGYSVHEIVYKRRCGDGFDPSMRSKFRDGRIGWRGFPIRSQDSIYRWQFDDHGGIQGVEQLAPPHYYHVTIPVEKFLHFRTTVFKNNPEGKSILRGAYRSWYMKKNIENIEAIGIERDLAGLPMALVPPDLMSANASAAQKALLAEIKNMVVNVRRDEQEGIVMPALYDAMGKPLYEFKLLSTGGSRQFDTDKIINRYDQRILMAALADFLLIGHQNVGSFSLVSARKDLFASAIGSFLDIIAGIFNRFAVTRLFDLNDFQISDYPKIMHGDLESVDLEVLGKYISTLASAGMPIFPDDELEKYLKQVAHLPEGLSKVKDIDQQVEPQHKEQPETVKEIPDSSLQVPTGLSQPADTTPVNGKPPVATVTTNELGNTEQALSRTKAKVQSPEQFTDWKKW